MSTAWKSQFHDLNSDSGDESKIRHFPQCGSTKRCAPGFAGFRRHVDEHHGRRQLIHERAERPARLDRLRVEPGVTKAARPATKARADADQLQGAAVREFAANRVGLERDESLARIARVAPGGAVRMLAPAVQRLRPLLESSAGLEQSQPEIEVLGPASLVPASDSLEPGAA